MITWREVDRISEENVEFYKRAVGELMFRQEFCCEFLDQAETVFPLAIIDACFDEEVTAWAV